MPVSSRRRIRSATAGGLRLTRRPRSAKVRRAFSWRASTRPQSVVSSAGVETAVMAQYYAGIDVDRAHLPWNGRGKQLWERIFFSYGNDDDRGRIDLGRHREPALGGGLAPGSRRRPYRPRGALAAALESVFKSSTRGADGGPRRWGAPCRKS